MSEERILTMHPKGRAGVNILKVKYELIKDFVITTIKEHEVITYQLLSRTSGAKAK